MGLYEAPKEAESASIVSALTFSSHLQFTSLYLYLAYSCLVSLLLFLATTVLSQTTSISVSPLPPRLVAFDSMSTPYYTLFQSSLFSLPLMSTISFGPLVY